MEDGSLWLLCMHFIEKNFDAIPDFSNLPGHVLREVISFLLEQRKWGSRTLNDRNIGKIFVPNLRDLDLESCWLSDAPFASFECTQVTSINLSGCLQVGDGALEKIGNCHQLQSLNIKGCNGVTDIGLRSLIHCVNLLVLCMNVGDVTESGLMAVAMNCTQLRKLDLRKATKVGDQVVLNFGNTCKGLETLVITEGLHMTDSSLSSFGKTFENLARLSLSGCSFKSPRLIGFGSLRRLKMNQCTSLVSLDLTEGCGGLEAVEIVRCPKLVSVLGISSVAPRLVCLDLSGCKRLTHQVVQSIVERTTTKLRALSLADCRTVRVDSIGLLEGSMVTKMDAAWCEISSGLSLSRMHLLHELSLEGTRVGDRDLRTILEGCQDLSYLTCKECHHLSDDCMDTLQNLRALKFLDLTKCLKLRNPSIHSESLGTIYLSWTAIKGVKLECPELATLDISGCTSLSDSPLIQLIKGSGWKLKNLWMTHSEWSDSVLHVIGEHCRTLQILNISNNDAITNQALHHVAKNCHHLRRVYLNAAMKGAPNTVEMIQKEYPQIIFTQRGTQRTDKSK